MYSAIYLPARPKGKEDPSRSGFATEQEAEEYVVNQMCDSCKEERRMALAGEKWEEDEDDGFSPSAYPGCFYEWVIGLTEKVGAAESFDELMSVCGWDVVYRRDNTPEENARLQAEHDEKLKRVN